MNTLIGLHCFLLIRFGRCLKEYIGDYTGRPRGESASGMESNGLDRSIYTLALISISELKLSAVISLDSTCNSRGLSVFMPTDEPVI